MTLKPLRVCAAHCKNGVYLEWHPDDESDARALLAHPNLVIAVMEDLLDESTLPDSEVVATIRVWPRSGEVEDIDVDDEYRRDHSAFWEDSIRSRVGRFAGGAA